MDRKALKKTPVHESIPSESKESRATVPPWAASLAFVSDSRSSAYRLGAAIPAWDWGGGDTYRLSAAIPAWDLGGGTHTDELIP